MGGDMQQHGEWVDGEAKAAQRSVTHAHEEKNIYGRAATLSHKYREINVKQPFLFRDIQ